MALNGKARRALLDILRYALALASVGIVTFITTLLQPIVDSFALFFAAVAFTSFFGGIGPGLVSVALATLAIDYYFVSMDGTLMLSPAGYLRLAVFMLLAGLVSWLGSGRKKAERSLQQANAELEARVLERTRELTKSKEVLETEIKERRQAEEQLREKAALLDLTHDTVVVRDMNDCIRYWNRGAQETYRYTPEEAIGAVSHILLKTVFPVPLEAIMREVSRAGRWSGELVHTRKDGAPVVAASRWALQADDGGNPIGVLEINNDITDHKNTTEALRRSQSELAHVTRVMAMGEMVSTITHEVNQPLCAIVTNSNACSRWLRAVPPDLDRAQDALQRITRDGNRASEVIARIRGLVKKTDGEIEAVQITDIIEDVLVVTAYDAQRNGVRIEKVFSPSVPRVQGDRVQLQQVVLNLVMNAVDAMRATKAKPRCLTIRVEPHDDGVLVVVQDSGPGITSDNLTRIFDPFFTTKTTGMGMGLSICQSIIRNHSGQIWVTSDDGTGAAFYFTLPDVKRE
jgi:two-component system, LuxR family, sensor kinase FixL